MKALPFSRKYAQTEIPKFLKLNLILNSLRSSCWFVFRCVFVYLDLFDTASSSRSLLPLRLYVQKPLSFLFLLIAFIDWSFLFRKSFLGHPGWWLFFWWVLVTFDFVDGFCFDRLRDLLYSLSNLLGLFGFWRVDGLEDSLVKLGFFSVCACAL